MNGSASAATGIWCWNGTNGCRRLRCSGRSRSGSSGSTRPPIFRTRLRGARSLPELSAANFLAMTAYAWSQHRQVGDWREGGPAGSGLGSSGADQVLPGAG